MWAFATLAAPQSWHRLPAPFPSIDEAAAASNCGALAELQHAVRDPLTVGRFWDNLIGAAGRTSLRFNPDPVKADAQLCLNGR